MRGTPGEIITTVDSSILWIQFKLQFQSSFQQMVIFTLKNTMLCVMTSFQVCQMFKTDITYQKQHAKGEGEKNTPEL
jgi:hypothetical protein